MLQLFSVLSALRVTVRDPLLARFWVLSVRETIKS
jgi:hypothetical protein